METQGQDRTALITGASSGIGLELTRRMLSEGWQVVALNRSEFPQDDPLLRDSLGTGRLRVYRADLSDFDSLRAAVAQIKAREAKLDVLFNNAGGSFPELTFSKQGRELHYEVQTVVPYILFMELKELLRKGSLRTVINTSTNAFDFIRRFDADTLERPPTFKKLLGPYAATKLAMALWTREVAPLAAADGITLRSVDPGGNNTLRGPKTSGLPFYAVILMKLFMPHPSRGASLLYEGALGTREKGSGVYLRNGVARELRFREQGAKVLDRVRAIHEREFVRPARA
ncbi:SDR family NAD(P)-dependent oxidoreductase [Pyxidicoccus xibeiensis]|uniref:SDR family NAD(P)-dependent oxidoreductase n=1 Tax=Pyxidicoccus xibeiensis TaxID=2906759 RepID=UPI0020A80CE1|nr:SDR family NAD(P)-dependent oxidoreductase [Pyxidicoccus xibeiensis]MCP3138634.1 SDR family NAD(P)-dependent oxidoreductase [Pyxidicoccus xibeiensis]